MLKRLRVRLVAVIMAIVTVLLCLMLGTICFLTQSNLEAESVRMLQAAAARPFPPGVPEPPAQEPREPYFVLRIGRAGEWTATGSAYYDLSDTAFLQTLAEAALAQEGQTGVVEAYGLRFYKAMTPGGQCLAFADIHGERAVLSSLLRACALIGALCLAVFFGVSILLAFWMVRPVDRAWRQQRQFVADASHELKTPLTVILSNAELLQLADCDAESRACCAQRILTMSRHMRELVERLLELARADDAQSRPVRAPLNFSELAEYALLPFEPLFFEKGLTLDAQIQPALFVEGDSRQLQQVLEILLDNAQKYAPAPGRVTLRLQRTDRRRCRLSVSNDCEPLEREELDRLFRRFYRRDAARSRDGSFGLGLAIAESIIAEHRGRIWAEYRAGRIAFLAELPLRRAPDAPEKKAGTAQPR